MKWIRCDSLELAAGALKEGRIAIVPTETVYGISCILEPSVIARIQAVKGRDVGKPMIVLASTLEEARTLAEDWPEAAEMLAQAFWPGPVSIVVQKSPLVPGLATGGGDTVAIRVPGLETTRHLIEKTGPLVSTSANRSGESSPNTAEQAVRQLGIAVDFVLDAGPLAGVESTVVSLISEPTVLREGAISAEQIAQALL